MPCELSEVPSMPNHGGHILEMRHRFLTATVAIALIGPVAGQFPFRNGFQSSNYASFGNGPRAPVNYGNLQNYAPYKQASFFSNSGSGIPRTNFQSNPAAGQASDAARASFFQQIRNHSPINNFQYANTFTNPVETQLSSADNVMSSLESNPLIKQFLPGSTNANGAQLIPYSQNGFAISYVPGSVMSSLENDPLIKQFFPGSTNANPVTNGAQLIQNSQNGFPISYLSGSNPLTNANPSYRVPASNAASASFFPQISNQPPINNYQYANSFTNPVGSQLSSADSIMSSLENNPLINQYLQGSTNANPVTNGAQLIQNSQNVFRTPYVTGSNPLTNINPGPGSDVTSASFFPQITYQPPINNIQAQNSFVNPVGLQFSSAHSITNQQNNPLIKQHLQGSTNPVTNGAQFIQNSQNRFPNPLPNGLNPLPNANPSNAILNSPENIPVIKQFLNDPANRQLVSNRAPNALANANPSDDVLDFIEKIPVLKQFLDNPANQQLVNNRAFNALPNANSSADILDLLEKNPLIKQFLNDPANQRLLINKSPLTLKPRRRYPPPFPIRPNYFPNSNSWSRADNYDTDVTDNSPDGNTPTNSPTIPTFSFTDDSSNNPTPDVTTFPTSMTDTTSTSIVLNSENSLLDYSLPSDVPLEYPKSDFPQGFFVDMLKSLGANSKKASTIAAIQPKRRRKCKAPRSRTGNDNSSKIPVAANTEPTDTGSNTISPSDTKLTTVYPSDILKQFTLNNIKVIDSLGASKAPSSRKRKCRKRPKTKVTDIVSKIPNYSDLATAADTSSITTTPQTATSKSVTIIDTKNTNQNSDLTAVGLSSVRPKKKKKCNKTRVKPKAESGNSQNDFLQGQTDISPSFIGNSVKGILNLSNGSNNDTNFRSSDKSQKSRKCQLKKERMKAANFKGLTAVSPSGPTDVMSAGNNKQNGAATDSSETNNVAVKATTVGPDSCGEDEVWWDCKPLNNTCRNVARGKSQKNFICESGCYCADDLVKDVDGTCVDPDDCAAPVCKDEDHEEITDCLIECNRCEDDCHPCQMQSCVNGCDCKDGYKRNDNGICVLDIHCPPCPTDVISD